MAHIFTVIGSSVARGLLFNQITRYINPELLSAGVFAFALFGSPWLDTAVVEAMANGIIIEFVMIHANAGIGAAQVFATTETSRKKFILVVSGFYFLFVGGLALGIGAWWMAICFVLLTWSRLQEPAGAVKMSEMINEIVVTMARFFVYMVMGLVCAGIGTLIGADDPFKMLAWGACYFLALFLLRKKVKRLRELNLFGREKKGTEEPSPGTFETGQYRDK